jgi:hypothetical protein
MSAHLRVLHLCSVAAAAAVAGGGSSSSPPTGWTLSTRHLAVTFGEGGALTAVVDKATGRNHVLPNIGGSLAAAPQRSLISAVFTKPAKWGAAAPPTKVVYDESARVITATFSNGAVVPASVNITDDMIILTLMREGAQYSGLADVLFLTTPLLLPSCAVGPTAVFDESFAMLLLPGSYQIAVGAVQNGSWDAARESKWPNAAQWDLPHDSCTVSPAGVILRAHASGPPFAGRSAALWGGRRADLDAAIVRGEGVFGLPSPRIDGTWAKRSPDATKGYFLSSATPSTLAATISYAAQAGMGYVTLLDNIWEGEGGHYNFSEMWGGADGMKQAVRQIRAAGLKAGMHTMSGIIVKTDRYVTPVPDPRLAKRAANTLAAAVDEHAMHLPLAQPTTGMPTSVAPLSKIYIDIPSN